SAIPVYRASTLKYNHFSALLIIQTFKPSNLNNRQLELDRILSNAFFMKLFFLTFFCCPAQVHCKIAHSSQKDLFPYDFFENIMWVIASLIMTLFPMPLWLYYIELKILYFYN